MTRQEKGLWVTVIVLAAALLFTGSWMLFSGGVFRDNDSKPEGDSPAVASVQDRAITEDEWMHELKTRYGREVLVTLINRQVVELEARAIGIQVSPEEVEKELERHGEGYGSKERYLEEMQQQFGLTEKMLKTETEYRLALEKIATVNVQVPNSEVDDYLREHPDLLQLKKQLNLAIIKVDTEREADVVLDRLEAGEDFAALAREVSTDEYTKDHGGRIGQVEEDDPFQPAAVLEMAASLNEGDIAGPVQLEDGYAIIHVLEIITPEAPDEGEVRETVRRQLALEQAEPLPELEEKLRDKYGARIVAGISGQPNPNP